MHPELLNNSLFLKYYNIWRKDPGSITFVPLAEYLLHYQRNEDAIKVCLEGIQHNPQFVSGRITLAKGYIKVGDFKKAKEQLLLILNQVANHQQALELMRELEEKNANSPIEHSHLTQPTPSINDQPADTSAKSTRSQASWETLTMGRILEEQGHKEQARQVYQNILAREPNNQEAQSRLNALTTP